MTVPYKCYFFPSAGTRRPEVPSEKKWVLNSLTDDTTKSIKLSDVAML